MCLAALCAVTLAGCGSADKVKTPKPVVGPPPPRVSLANDSPSEPVFPSTQTKSPIQPAGRTFVSPRESNLEFADTEVVAYVNGEAILAGEILDQYDAKLQDVKQQISADQYRQLRYQLLERDLPKAVDNKLLVQAFKATLDPEQEQVLKNAMNTMFDEYVANIKGKLGVNTDHELELVLHKEGSSLELLQRGFADQVMAEEYKRSKQRKAPTPSRIELLEHYERIKQEEYFHPAQVRWEQIEISYGTHGSKQGAYAVLKQAVADLKRGMPFADVARQYSDGPGAEQGGYWDWMPRGSLANQEIENALFAMPIGQISDIYVGDTSYQIVRVLERKADRYDPFEEVQEDLKAKLAEKHQERSSEKVVEELRAKSSIVTIFDKRHEHNGDDELLAPAGEGTIFGRQPRSSAPQGRHSAGGAGSFPFQ